MAKPDPIVIPVRPDVSPMIAFADMAFGMAAEFRANCYKAKGEPVPDAVLVELAPVRQIQVRPGDKFVVTCPHGASPRDAEAIARHVAARLGVDHADVAVLPHGAEIHCVTDALPPANPFPNVGKLDNEPADVTVDQQAGVTYSYAPQPDGSEFVAIYVNRTPVGGRVREVVLVAADGAEHIYPVTSDSGVAQYGHETREFKLGALIIAPNRKQPQP